MGHFYRASGTQIPTLTGRPLTEEPISYGRAEQISMRTKPPIRWVRGEELTTGVGQFVIVPRPDKGSVQFDHRDDTVYLRIVHDGNSWKSMLLEVPKSDHTRIESAYETEPPLMDGHAAKYGYHRPDWQLFPEQIGPLDVSQGEVGDCRIASALQAIANSKKGDGLLRRLITKVGDAYAVTLKEGGGPKIEVRGSKLTQETVSGYLPWSPEWQGPLYMQRGMVPDPRDRRFFPGRDPAVLWPAIIEKALAQRWGGYQAMHSAEERAAFSMLGLTGVFTCNWQSGSGTTRGANKETGRKTIIANAAKGAVMTTNGFGTQHNYALLAVDEDGVVVSDPNTRDFDLEKRFTKPDKAEEGDKIPAADMFPRRYPWPAFLKSFNWVYGAYMPD